MLMSPARRRRGGGAVLALSSHNVSTARVGSSTTATLRLDADGDIMGSNGAGTSVTSDRGDWINPKSAAGGAYECRVTVTSGTLTSGTSGSWQALSSDRSWAVTQASIGNKTCVFTLEIREVANTSNVVSATITLSATYEL